mmetsp:Transcript_46985/g.117165  ORF Transcript_46985/g.117165 Transcript_46985/m.117165 type:complete len:258 (+) Transcript_46985:369-1142(+)
MQAATPSLSQYVQTQTITPPTWNAESERTDEGRQKAPMHQTPHALTPTPTPTVTTSRPPLLGPKRLGVAVHQNLLTRALLRRHRCVGGVGAGPLAEREFGVDVECLDGDVWGGVEEEWDGVAVGVLGAARLLLAVVHHAMHRRLEQTARPHLQHVADIDNEGVGDVGDLPPCARGVAHLQAASRILVKQRETPIVRMGSACYLLLVLDTQIPTPGPAPAPIGRVDVVQQTQRHRRTREERREGVAVHPHDNGEVACE